MGYILPSVWSALISGVMVSGEAMVEIQKMFKTKQVEKYTAIYI